MVLVCMNLPRFGSAATSGGRSRSHPGGPLRDCYVPSCT